MLKAESTLTRTIILNEIHPVDGGPALRFKLEIYRRDGDYTAILYTEECIKYRPFLIEDSEDAVGKIWIVDDFISYGDVTGSSDEDVVKICLDKLNKQIFGQAL